MYKDRHHAAQALIAELSRKKLTNPIVAAIPRGGVVMGAELARAIGADLEVVTSKKIGAPGNPEYAIAAVDPDGSVTRPSPRVEFFPDEYIEREAVAKKRLIDDALRHWRRGRQEKDFSGRTVVVVDDGLATGLTALSAIRYVRRKGPSSIILAVPVAPEDTVEHLRHYVDELICPLVPRIFFAVGEWYDRFDQVSDEEVATLLEEFSSNPRAGG